MSNNVNELKSDFGSAGIKEGFAKMQKGGVIMDVTTVEQAKIAEESGAVAVMALERVPSDIRADGKIARMAAPELIQKIIEAVSIPVMAKVRIGHFVEAQILETIGVDMIDESEVLTPADPFYHINKKKFTVPFVCGCTTLGEAIRRIWEGASMLRTKGEAGTGNIIEAVRHQRIVMKTIEALSNMNDDELLTLAENYSQSYLNAFQACTEQTATDTTIIFADATYNQAKEGIHQLLRNIQLNKRLPVVNFAAGGIATPADAAIMMQLGSDGVFVGSGIFKSSNPLKMASSIVKATINYQDPKKINEVSRNTGDAISGIDISTLEKGQLLQGRGW